jgi:hypothetical protein
MANTCKWPLGNGQLLEFTIYDSNENWRAAAGLYIFASLTKDGWYPLYIGQADDFSSRLPNHERLEEAVRLGATHIHAVVVPHAANRDKWERMLIQNFRPPMNTRLR